MTGYLEEIKKIKEAGLNEPEKDRRSTKSYSPKDKHNRE